MMPLRDIKAGITHDLLSMRPIVSLLKAGLFLLIYEALTRLLTLYSRPQAKLYSLDFKRKTLSSTDSATIQLAFFSLNPIHID
jgi:hypothetical protein